MSGKRGNANATWKKQCAAYIRCVAVVIALSLLAAVFMSVAGSVPVRASGLVDDTVDESNLYSKYSVVNYQLDHVIEVSWIPTQFLENAVLGNAVFWFTNNIWWMDVMLSSGTGYVVQEAFELDFVSSMAEDVGKNIQTLAGLSKSGISPDGFYAGFLLLVVLAVGIYAAYTGLFRRETSKAVGAVVNMLLVFLLSAGFIVYAPDYIKNINEFSSDVSGAVLDLGAQLVMSEDDGSEGGAVDRVRNLLFNIQVYKPWLLLQFGTTDEAAIGTERIEKILSLNPVAQASERREAVKADAETYENTNVTTSSVGSRLGTVLVIVVLNLIISLFVFMMAAFMILSQLLFIIFAMFLPISFVLSMFPTYNGMAKKALLKVFNTIMMRAGLTLAITVAFSLSAMVYSLSSEYPFFMVAFLQIVVYAGVYLKLNDILGMISLQDGQGGNRRGALMRSLGRYVVMRRILGGRGRYSHRRVVESDNASSSGGNGGGGSSGRSSSERSGNVSNTRTETSASSEGVRQTYGVIDENSGQRLSVSAERLQRFRDKKVDVNKYQNEDGSSVSYHTRKGPGLKRDRTYGDVIDYEPNVGKFEDLQKKRDEKLRERKEEAMRADIERGALKVASREKSQLKWRAENGEAVSGQKINASKEQLKKSNGNRGIERAMAKGDIYRDGAGKLRVPKNAPSDRVRLSGENAGKISREKGKVRLEYGVVGESSKQKLPVSSEDMQRFRDADARGKINADYRAKKGPGLKVNQTYGTIVDYEPNVGKLDESKTERPVTESVSGMERHSAETKTDMSQTVKTGIQKKLKSSRQTVVRSEFHARSGRAEKDDGEPGKEK